jgi:hypothetical protein
MLIFHKITEGQTSATTQAHPEQVSSNTSEAQRNDGKDVSPANGKLLHSMRYLSTHTYQTEDGNPEDESGTSGSDYGGQREALMTKRRKAAERGQSVSDTDEEDAELDHQASEEAVNETSDNDHSQLKRGKQAASPEDLVQCSDDDDDNTIEASDTWPKVSGPLPKEGRLEAQRLAAAVTEEAEKIARKYKKSVRDIMLAAGLGIRAARTRNPHNMFKRWYAHHHPNKDSEYTYAT